MQYRFLRDVVLSILKAPHRHEWSLQGFGMLRTYLGDDARIHIWDSAFKVPDVTEVHTHPWDFESVVIAGKMIDEIYVFGERLSVVAHVWNEGLITCGPAPKNPNVRDVRQRTLLNRIEKEYSAGDGYALDARVPHRSIPMDGTVTVIRRTHYLPDRDTALVFWPVGTERVTAEPRLATTKERDAIIGRALERWF